MVLIAFIPDQGMKFSLVSYYQLAFLVLHLQRRPYKHTTENVMEFTSLTSLLLLTFVLH